ncbi:MAG: PAS domain S-box protein [Ignavibacteria bacterium]|nr:PAS domain S-box protein [Ignavibacteria bacterium]
MASKLFSKYGRVFDLLPEIILVLDSKQNLIDLNRSAILSLGYDPEGPHPEHLEQLIPAEDWKTFSPKLLQQKDHEAFEAHLKRSDGSLIDVSVEIKELASGDKRFQVVIARDITEIKKRELEYLQFSNVIHYTINPIQITDAKGIMVYVNPAFEKASGYRKEELIGRNPRLLSSGKHSRDFWKNVWEQILSGKIWVGEIENRRKDGTAFHAELVISPIEDGNGNVVGFLGAHRDITEQKILQQQLIRSQKMESIGTLAAGIAHEVGNPLTSISSLVQVIQRTTTDDFTREKLELIKNQITRIAKIIRDLVDFSRPSTHVVKLTDLNHVLKEALSIVQYGKKVKDIVFHVELSESLPKLQIVPDQLSQVFINILINAVDAIDGKPGEISIRSGASNGRVQVSIRDSGKGIAPEDCEKIFEPFYTTKEVGRGSGLGLWVSYGIVKSFDGDIEVESLKGRGSTFHITLPINGE